MAAGVRTIKTRFTGDTRNLEKASDRASGKLSRFSRKMGRGLATAAKVGAVAVAGVGIAAFVVGRDLVGLASQAEQSIGAVSSVFGGNAAKIEQWAKGAAKNVGLSANAFREMAAVTGAQLKNMGVPVDQVAGQTNDLIGLGADLAATFGGPTSNAVAALGSLLRGETDPIEQYGVSIKQADINAKLAQMGLEGLEGQAGKNARTQALLALLTEQTADATGSFARESNTAAGQAQRSQAMWQNLRTELGMHLLPIVTKVGQFLTGTLLPRLKDLAEWVRIKLVPALKDLAGWFGEHLLPKLQAVAGFIGDKVIPAIAGLVGWINKNREIIPAVGIAIGALLVPAFIAWAISAGAAAIATIAAAAPIILIGLLIAALAFLIIKNWDTIRNVTVTVFTAVWGFLKGLWEKVTGFIGRAIGFVKNIFLKFHPVGIIIRNWQPIWGFITGLWDKVMGFLRRIPGKVKSAFSTVGNVISAPFRAGFDAVKRFWNNTIGGKGFTIPSWVPAVGGKSFRFPRFHAGGVVPGPAGAEVPILARAGERVLTREQDQAAGGGQFTGTLVLSSGEFLGVVDGRISRSNRDVNRRVLAGAGRAA